jgi:transglutaminase-like putative cysteine protease
MNDSLMVLPGAVLVRLFIAVFLSILLHLSDVSVWLFVGATIFIVWRYTIYRYGFIFPNVWLRIFLVAMGFSFVYLLYGWMPSIESMLTLLIAGIVLKLIEVQFQRDAYLLIFACYFLQSLHFLFDQSPLHYIAVLFSCVFTLYVQVYLNKNLVSVEGDGLGRSDKKVFFESLLAVKLLLLSLPLALFLFFALPRLAPLWSISVPTESAVIGLSERMAPGDIGRLGKSDDLAFRVKFKNNVPDMRERYWRVLILDYYDGNAWEQGALTHSKAVIKPSLMSVAAADQALNDYLYYEYDVVAEASQKKWLFALANVTGVDANVSMVEGRLLRNKKKLLSPFKYTVVSAVHNGLLGVPALLTTAERQSYLQLPLGLNQKTKDLADSFWLETGSVTGFMARVQRYISQGQFSYTLTPNVLKADSQIDEFLFESQLGFCAHYAGALTYMLRSVGIPSRIVLGYLGGEKNKHSDYYSVYQYDAHAWVEYWIEGKGWLRVDPTSWVSPDRIELGMMSAAKDEFVGFRSNSKWLHNIRHRFMSLNYLWQDWMLSYKGNKQQALLESIMGKRSGLELVLIGLMIFLVVSLVLFAIFMWPLRRLKSPIEKLFDDYKQVLEKGGADFVAKGLTHRQLGAQAVHLNSQNEVLVHELNSAFDQVLYEQQDLRLSKHLIIKIKKNIAELKAF